MIVDCALYRAGRRDEVDPARISELVDRARRGADEFAWVGLVEPDADELAKVADEFGLHPLAVEDAVKPHQRPKLEIYEDSIFAVFRTLSDDLATPAGQLMVFVGEGFVVTVRHGIPNPLAGIRERLETTGSDMLTLAPSGVLHAIADAVVDTYDALAANLDDQLDELEARVFSSDRTNDAPAIYQLKRRVLELRRAVLPLTRPMEELAAGTVPRIRRETLPFFRDVADHVARSAEHVDAADRLLTDILQAALAEVSVRQNDDMRRISAWVAIAAVPTLVGGIYGMNFQHMPELRWRYGYPLVLGVVALACYVLYRTFKRSGWL